MSASAKIHPTLATLLQTPEMNVAGAAAQPQIRIIVQHKGTMETMAAASAVGGVGSVDRQFKILLSGSGMRASPSAIRVLATRPDVEMIWLDEPVHTMLDVSVPLIQAPKVWDAGVTGQGVRVGIVDTGIDPDHADFAGRISVTRDFTGEGDRDGNGHGTHVAGIVGGTGAQSGGKFRGVAPECTYVIAKVLRGDGTGTMSDVIAGLEFVIEQRAQVINLSLGGGLSCDGTDALSVACDNATDLGVVVCVADGNDGPFPGTIGSPGCARKVITIGATDKQDQIANFSSRGPTSDGRVKPDVCFPGVGIHSCRARGTSMGTPLDEFYTTASGTSMATPHAAGTCALLLQSDPTLKPQQIKDAIMNTAKNLWLDPNTGGKGRADALAAFQSLGAPVPQPPPQPPPTPMPPPEPPPVPEPPPQGGGCLELVKSLFRG